MRKGSEEMRTFYLCDPKKNTSCLKKMCQKLSFSTTNIKCAKEDKNGNPIVEGSQPSLLQARKPLKISLEL